MSSPTQIDRTVLQNTYAGLEAQGRKKFPNIRTLEESALVEQGRESGRGGILNADAALGNAIMAGGGSVQDRRNQSGFADQPGQGGVGTDAIPSRGQQGGSSSGSSSSVSGGGTNFGELLTDRIDKAFSAFAPKTEEEILETEMDKIQDQINAINAVYDTRRLDAVRGNKGRLGQTKALNVASGTSFDPIGAAKVDERETTNQQILDAIEQERLAEIANITAAARGSATTRVERNADRLIEIANSEISALADAFGLSAQEAQSLRNEAISRANLTGELGGDPTIALRRFLSDEGQRQFDNTLSRDQFGLDERQTDANIRQVDSNISNANARLRLAEQEAARAGAELVQLPNGDFGYFDLDTRGFVTLGNFAAPRSGGGTGTQERSRNNFIEGLAVGVLNGENSFSFIEEDYGPEIAEDVEAYLRFTYDPTPRVGPQQQDGSF